MNLYCETTEKIIKLIREEIDKCRQQGMISIPTKLKVCPSVPGPKIYISKLEKLIDILKLPNMSFIDITNYLLNNPNILITNLEFINDIIDLVFSSDGPKYINLQKSSIQDFKLEDYMNSENFKKCILSEFIEIIINKNNYTLEMLASIQINYPDTTDFSLMLKEAFENTVLNELIQSKNSYTKK